MRVDSEKSDARVDVEELWFEILAPVENAHGAIMRALEGIVLPAGLSVAKSDRGTLLLNAKAWSTFHSALRSLTLQMQHPALPVATRGLRYSLLT